jgi:hypothetical protein
VGDELAHRPPIAARGAVPLVVGEVTDERDQLLRLRPQDSDHMANADAPMPAPTAVIASRLF